ncbi:MAG TPA: HAD family phosphatase [Bryobacteraceae bacterium]|nr:HAD family phosphatase [Bryobacteraceae bacterium]
MYKAIIFDLGKVLVHFDFKLGYRELEGLCPYPAAEIPKRIRPTGLVERFETGQIEPRDFVEQLCRALDLDVDYDRFCTIWSCIFCQTLVPERLLEGLATRYRLLLLSNTNALHFEMIRRNYPIIRHFHDLILSYEVRAMKPNPEIYRAAISRAGCLPEECFFTDDIPEYVEGARQMGIDAVQFQSAGQLEGELQSRGIVWE